MSKVEREIRRRLDELTENLLIGVAPDYQVYRDIAVRRDEIKRLADLVDEYRKDDQGDVDDNE